MGEKRTLKIQYAKGGSGSKTTRLTIPITWIKEMGISEENREVEVSFDNGKIVIQKKDLD